MRTNPGSEKMPTHQKKIHLYLPRIQLQNIIKSIKTLHTYSGSCEWSPGRYWFPSGPTLRASPAASRPPPGPASTVVKHTGVNILHTISETLINCSGRGGKQETGMFKSKVRKFALQKCILFVEHKSIILRMRKQKELNDESKRP